MDLLSCLPEEIQCNIFQHLNVQTILTASQVCHQWNYIIGKSKVCMERITLNCTPININFDLNSIMNSNRDYKRIKINFKQSYINEIDSIIRTVLKKFSKSITFIESTNDLLRIGDLPKLKELRIDDQLYKTRRYSYLLCSRGMVTSFTSIAKLTIQSTYMDNKSSRILNKGLKEMINLKSLSVNHIDFLSGFKTDYFQFELEEFTYFEYRYPVPSLAQLFEFLTSQNSSLKSIRCDPITFDEASFFLLNFPNLTSFHFHGLIVMSNNHDTAEITEFPTNKTIKRLIVGMDYTKQNFVNLLSNLKNIQQLHVCVLFGELIPAIFESPTIKEVRYHYLSDNVTETQKIAMVANGVIDFAKVQSFTRCLH